MTSLGERIRQVYINKYSINISRYGQNLTKFYRLQFLPDQYDEKTLYIRSSDYIRTQESVQQLVAEGLYPKEKRPEDFVLKLRIR
jgi:acid phosphatase